MDLQYQDVWRFFEGLSILKDIQMRVEYIFGTISINPSNINMMMDKII